MDVVIEANDNSSRSRKLSQSLIHDSYSSSLDFPAYIPWQTLSSDLSDKLRYGSVKINRSNCIEWTTIEEENEKLPLLDKLQYLTNGDSCPKKGISPAVSTGITWPVAAFLLINCALGAGVLNYPAAYDRVGGVLIATITQIILIIILTATLIILVYASDINKDGTYHDVLLSICGKKAQRLSAISILLTCYGVCVTFLIIIGDQYDRIFVSHLDECYWYINRKFTIGLTACVLILPMCYFKRLDFLRYAGTLGVFAMFYVVFINVYQYFKLDISSPPIKTRPDNAVSAIAVLPVICFAYQCHEIAVPVYACMEKRTVGNFSKATAFALGLLFVLYCCAGTCGYLTFGTKVTQDIMQLYDAKDPIVLIGIVALTIKMITTYPPMVFCGRGAIDGLYAELVKLSTQDFIRTEKKRRIIITTIWFFSSLFFAIYTPNIGVIIELMGSLASANVFMFPSLCLIKITQRKDRQLSNFYKVVLYSFSIFLILSGVLTFGIVLYQVYQDLVIEKVPTNDVLCK